MKVKGEKYPGEQGVWREEDEGGEVVGPPLRGKGSREKGLVSEGELGFSPRLAVFLRLGPSQLYQNPAGGGGPTQQTLDSLVLEKG